MVSKTGWVEGLSTKNDNVKRLSRTSTPCSVKWQHGKGFGVQGCLSYPRLSYRVRDCLIRDCLRHTNDLCEERAGLLTPPKDQKAPTPLRFASASGWRGGGGACLRWFRGSSPGFRVQGSGFRV